MNGERERDGVKRLIEREREGERVAERVKESINIGN